MHGKPLEPYLREGGGGKQHQYTNGTDQQHYYFYLNMWSETEIKLRETTKTYFL